MWNDVPAYPTPLILLVTALAIALALLGVAALLDLARDWYRRTRRPSVSRRDVADLARQRAAVVFQLWAVVTPDRDAIVLSTVRTRREDAEAFLGRPPFDQPGYHVEPVSLSLGPPSPTPLRS